MRVTCATPLAQVGARWRISPMLSQYQCAHTSPYVGAEPVNMRDTTCATVLAQVGARLAQVVRGGGRDVRTVAPPKGGYLRTVPTPTSPRQPRRASQRPRTPIPSAPMTDMGDLTIRIGMSQPYMTLRPDPQPAPVEEEPVTAYRDRLEAGDYAGDGPEHDAAPASDDDVAATAAAEAKAAELGVDLVAVEGSGKGGKVTVGDVEAAAGE